MTVTFVISNDAAATDRRIVAEELAGRLRAFLGRTIRVGDTINEDLDGWVLDVGYCTQVVVGWDTDGHEYSIALVTRDARRNVTTPAPVAQFHDHLAKLVEDFLASDDRVSAVRWCI